MNILRYYTLLNLNNPPLPFSVIYATFAAYCGGLACY